MSIGTPFVMPRQAPLLSGETNGVRRSAANSYIYFEQTIANVDQAVYKDPACEEAHPEYIYPNSAGILPAFYLNPDESSDYQTNYYLRSDASVGSPDDAESPALESWNHKGISRYVENFETGDLSWDNLGGFSGTPTISQTTGSGFYRFGRLVQLVLPAISGTSSATTFDATGVIPAAARPSGFRYGFLPYATDNSAHVSAAILIGDNGAIEFTRGNAAYSGSNWTNSGTKGIGGTVQQSVWYRL